MIAFENVSFQYDKLATLKNVSFALKKGEFVAIVGGNGAGKSTMIKMMNGLLKPTTGKVIVDGLDTAVTKTSVFARKVGFLFQNPDRQICKNTIREEIALGLKCLLKEEAQIERRCQAMLEQFGFDGGKDPFTMSRGERQKIALASVLALEPEVLVLDEPTTGLDYRECMHIMDLVAALHAAGTTVVMVSHDMEIVSDFAGRVIVLEDGEILADGDVGKVLYSEVLKNSQVIPPQMVGLGQELGFQGIFTVSQMADAVEGRLFR